MLHLGSIIKEVCVQKNVKLSQFADSIGTSKQNIIGIYKRKSLDSELLFKISKALKYNFFKHYIIPEDESFNENKEMRKLKINITNLETELDEAKKEITYLREITNLQRKQLNKKK
jgi:transcriptional regulator with XRE-family HTH domain